MDQQCPQCNSTAIGPSFTFDFDRDESGRVIARDPHFECGRCGHVWQVQTVMLLAAPMDPEDDAAIEAFVDAINQEILDAD